RRLFRRHNWHSLTIIMSEYYHHVNQAQSGSAIPNSKSEKTPIKSLAFLPAGKIRGPRPRFFPLFAFAKLDPALLVSPLFSPFLHRELP
ncbi:MAG: hypothetical protein LBI94_07270, partial [Treponema sp.]|nr:hypothetical protein [Treponema sp.]